MTDRRDGVKFKRIRSMRYGLLAAIVTGAVIATAVYLLLRFTCNYFISTHYSSEWRREERERAFARDLQTYIDENNVSSTNTGELSRWVRMNRYVHILIYKEDELFYSSGELGITGDTNLPLLSGGGLTVDYPAFDELMKYAEENDLYPIMMEDGALFASVSDFTEYFYYDIANMISLGAAMLALAVAMILYFQSVLTRITRLAKDVSVVSDGNMHHNIHYDGDDELTRLSYNVEQMRSSMLKNIQLEREARDSNAELITSMSHDIRTPLTVLLGYLEMMKESPHGKELDEYIRASHKTALRLKKLSDDMFKYALVFGADDAAVTLSEYDAGVLIEQLLAEHILLLAEGGYTVEPVFEGTESATGVYILTDPPNLMRIVDNVFSNLSKYADKAYPVRFKVIFSEGEVALGIGNVIRSDIADVESNGIGLKTCRKLAEALGHGFSLSRTDREFEVKITFKTVAGSPDGSTEGAV